MLWSSISIRLSPSMTPSTFDIDIKHPAPIGIIAWAACFIPRAVPWMFTFITRSNSLTSKSTMFLCFGWLPSTPALFKSTLNLPYHETDELIKYSMFCLRLMSQCMSETKGPNGFANAFRAISVTSAMTSLAPYLAKSWTVASPIPLAPPVTIAIFPSNLFILSALISGYENKQNTQIYKFIVINLQENSSNMKVTCSSPLSNTHFLVTFQLSYGSSMPQSWLNLPMAFQGYLHASCQNLRCILVRRWKYY